MTQGTYRSQRRRLPRRVASDTLIKKRAVYAGALRRSRPVPGQHNATRCAGPRASTRGMRSGAARICGVMPVTDHAYPVPRSRARGESWPKWRHRTDDLRITTQCSMHTPYVGALPQIHEICGAATKDVHPTRTGKGRKTGSAVADQSGLCGAVLIAVTECGAVASRGPRERPLTRMSAARMSPASIAWA